MKFHWLFTSGKDTGHPPNPFQIIHANRVAIPHVLVALLPETPSISALRVVRIFAIDPPEKKLPAKNTWWHYIDFFQSKFGGSEKSLLRGPAKKKHLKTNG